MERQGMLLFGAYHAVTIPAGDIAGMGTSSSGVRQMAEAAVESQAVNSPLGLVKLGRIRPVVAICQYVKLTQTMPIGYTVGIAIL